MNVVELSCVYYTGLRRRLKNLKVWEILLLMSVSSISHLTFLQTFTKDFWKTFLQGLKKCWK